MRRNKSAALFTHFLTQIFTPLSTYFQRQEVYDIDWLLSHRQYNLCCRERGQKCLFRCGDACNQILCRTIVLKGLLLWLLGRVDWLLNLRTKRPGWQCNRDIWPTLSLSAEIFGLSFSLNKHLIFPTWTPIKSSKMGSLDMSQNQSGISSRFASQNSNKKSET